MDIVEWARRCVKEKDRRKHYRNTRLKVVSEHDNHNVVDSGSSSDVHRKESRIVAHIDTVFFAFDDEGKDGW